MDLVKRPVRKGAGQCSLTGGEWFQKNRERERLGEFE